MNSQRLAVVLSLLNLVLFAFNSAHIGQATAAGDAPVLRGRELQIVDDKGAVRASISVHPANPTQPMPNGTTGSPDTAILRLIDPNGRPAVKIWASEQGAGLFFVGDSEATQVWLGADGGESSLKLTNKDGREQRLRP